jgi:hypothetical protein
VLGALRASVAGSHGREFMHVRKAWHITSRLAPAESSAVLVKQGKGF